MPQRRAPHPDLPALGARLRHVRKAAGCTQERLADAVGITAQAISLYEAGKSSLRISTLLHLAAALRVRVGSLLDVELPLPEVPPEAEGAEMLRYYLPLEARDRELAVRLVRDVAAERSRAYAATPPPTRS